MLAHDTAIEEIPVKRTTILNRLKTNKTKHAEEYTESFLGYQTKTVALLEEAAIAARKALNSEAPVSFDLDRLKITKPVDHTKDYELAIDVMENWDGDVVKLSPTDFAQFMRDDWAWAEQHRDTYFSNSGVTGSTGAIGVTGIQGPTGPRDFIRPVSRFNS